MSILITPRGDSGTVDLGGGAGRSGRLVVVSNRVPIPSGADAPGAGGLAVALEAALRQRGGLWYGWSGAASRRLSSTDIRASAFVIWKVRTRPRRATASGG